MSDVNTGTNPFPTTALQAGGNLFWARSSQSDAVARPWIVVANERYLYLMVNPQPSGQNYSATGMFGDFLRASSTDVFNCVMHGNPGDPSGNTAGSRTDDFDHRGQGNCLYTARDYFGLGAAVRNTAYYPTFNGTTSGYRSGSASGDHIPFPNDSDGSVYLAPWNIITQSSVVLRGRLPGFFAFPQRVGNTGFPSLSRISGVVGYPNKRFVTVTSSEGAYAFDVTGPWD